MNPLLTTAGGVKDSSRFGVLSGQDDPRIPRECESVSLNVRGVLRNGKKRKKEVIAEGGGEGRGRNGEGRRSRSIGLREKYLSSYLSIRLCCHIV